MCPRQRGSCHCTLASCKRCSCPAPEPAAGNGPSLTRAPCLQGPGGEEGSSAVTGACRRTGHTTQSEGEIYPSEGPTAGENLAKCHRTPLRITPGHILVRLKAKGEVPSGFVGSSKRPRGFALFPGVRTTCGLRAPIGSILWSEYGTSVRREGRPAALSLEIGRAHV